MANVKLGTKTFSGVKAVKLNTVDGGTVTFPDKEETPGGGFTYGNLHLLLDNVTVRNVTPRMLAYESAYVGAYTE